MQSLRKNKSQAPRKGRNAPSKAKQDAPNPRDFRKSRVDDKIKRRMSMRYADISNPTDLGIPAVPSLPLVTDPRGGRAPSREQDEVVRDRAGSKEDQKESDKKILDSEEFDPDAFLQLKLANSTEAELRSLQSSLRAAQDDTAVELQHSVFKNYAEFVLISKEITTLENEMLELKESLSEWKSMPSVLHIDDSASLAERKRAARSSVADLRILYANQMQTLHSQIEGSAKFAPTISGRHVVAEVEGVFSLNAATYKVNYTVRFVVLDDMVLVARRRRRQNAGNSSNTGEGKLVAEKCWPLNEMLVLDTKDSPNMTNVFKIRHNKETYVYRTEAAADKKSLLSQFRLVAEELAAKKRKEREGEHERRKSLWNGGDRASFAHDVPPVPDWMADLAEKAGVGDGTSAKEKSERDIRWVGEWADDLTVAIALREWEKAVALVEQGMAKLSTTPPLVTKLPALKSTLIASLLSSLSQSNNRKSTVVSLISLLLRLDAGPAARVTFLDMRSKVMKANIRKIMFEGHVGTYVGDLAVVSFTVIKHTADWFLASFKENDVASCFIDWAKMQIESYAEMFRRQVYSSDVDSQTVDEAMRITYSQSKKLLQEYGLDFRFLLDELLVEKPKVKAPPPFAFPSHQMPKIDAPVTPSPTPTRHRSPAPPASSTSSPVPPPSAYPSVSVSSASASSSSTSVTSSSGYNTPTPSVARPSSPDAHYPPPSAYQPPVTNRAAGRAPIIAAAAGGSSAPMTPVASPSPRRARTPPPRAPSPLRPGSSASGRVPLRQRGSPAPPPRSTNRPGSAMGHRPPPVAVPQREGMI